MLNWGSNGQIHNYMGDIHIKVEVFGDEESISVVFYQISVELNFDNGEQHIANSFH